MPTSAPLFLAFVLKRSEYSNTSLLLELFGDTSGRIAAIARGARRPHQHTSALLQPFQPLWLACRGRGAIQTLTTIEEASPPLALHGPALLAGFYLNELLMRLLARHDPHPALFVFYQATLAQLAATPELETPLRHFECHLLAELGYGLTLERVVDDGAPIQPTQVYTYVCDCGPCYPSERRHGPLVSGATLLALAQSAPLDATQRREARKLLRMVLEPYLGGRPLQSRELYRRWFAAHHLHES